MGMTCLPDAEGVAADDMLDLFFANEVVACRMVGGDDAAGNLIIDGALTKAI